MTVAAITGHRPEKIDDPDWVRQALREAYQRLGVLKVIQGLASGVDLWSAVEAFNMDIPYIAARPWAGHKPRNADKELYDWVLAHAEEVVDVTNYTNFPGNWVYQKRNKWMIEHGNFVLSVWDGIEKGGTWNAVEHACKIGYTVFNCNPRKKVCDFLVTSSPV